MIKKNDKIDDCINLKHKANENENYFLTILDDFGLSTINLSNLNKRLITFGSGEQNDIVLHSDAVDIRQGYLQITEYGVLAVNTNKKASLVSNNNKVFSDIYLSEGSFLKLVSNENSESSGILFIMSLGKNVDEWKYYPLQVGKNTIGSSSSCDIVLPPVGVSKKHASINVFLNQITIQNESSLSGTYINGNPISNSKSTPLNNLDVIIIGNSKIILHNNKIVYQILKSGIQIDAIDIVKQVRIKFKIREISSHVSMSIKPAEFVAFVGASGAGKSTFMKCISGLSKPTFGEVLLNGEDLYENYDTLKYNIGYVPQDDIVYPNLTLHDMLHYAAKLRMPDNTTRKERNQRVQEVLSIVQLSEFENSYIRQLSGGQRKRASIAVELIGDPNLFFLDEPTSGLDPGTERSIMKTLRQMSHLGKTIILVTHNTLNLNLCDKVAFFGDRGRLCFYGSPQEALEFFGVDDFVDIYTLLNDNTSQWYEKFKNTQDNINISDIESENTKKVKPKKKSFIKQLIILIKRYCKLIANNYLQLILLFIQAPVIAVLVASVADENLYSVYKITKGVLFSTGCACIWLGLLNSVQEICKEKVILQKEYISDLKLPAYLLSKFIVQGFIAFIQATLMVTIIQNMVGQSENSILIDGYWDIQIICFLTILSASALGLFVSALVKDSTIALSLAPILLVPQLLFSGILFELEGFSDFVSNFVLCRWAIEGLGTSVNLNETTHPIQEFNPLATVEPESYFTFTSEHMISVILIIIAMTLVLLLMSYFVLRKKVNRNI